MKNVGSLRSMGVKKEFLLNIKNRQGNFWTSFSVTENNILTRKIKDRRA